MNLIPYDSAAGFTDPEAQAELLNDAIAEGDAHYLAHALGIIARARGMAEVQRETVSTGRRFIAASAPRETRPATRC